MIKWQAHDRVGYYKGSQKPVISRGKEPQGHPFTRPFIGTVYINPFITIVSQVGLTQRLKPDRFWMVLEDCRSAPESSGMDKQSPESEILLLYISGVIDYIPSQKKAKLENDDFQISKTSSCHMFLHVHVNWLPANQVFFGGLYSHFLIHGSTSDPVYPKDPLLVGVL